MRQFCLAFAVILPTCLLGAEPDTTAVEVSPLPGPTEFKLGGAASRAAVAPDIVIQDTAPPQPRLTLPRSPGDQARDLSEARFGPATLFVGDGIDDGRDAVQMGTFLSRGGARAGVSVTYLSREKELSRSELFVDYALTDQFSVGLSGILNTEIDQDDPVPQMGVSAEFSSEGGDAYLQGGFAAGSDEYDPVVGLSVGLRF